MHPEFASKRPFAEANEEAPEIKVVDTDATASKHIIDENPSMLSPRGVSREQTNNSSVTSKLKVDATETKVDYIPKSTAPAHEPWLVTGPIKRNLFGMSRATVAEVKQGFNVLYFLLTGCSLVFLSDIWHFPLLNALSIMFFVFSLGAFAMLLKKRSDFTASFDISPSLSQRIRMCALVTPLPLIITAAVLGPSELEFKKGVELNNQKNYREAILHLSIASALAPDAEKALDALSFSYNRTSDRPSALAAADAALAINPKDPEALANRAWALDALNKPDEAIQAAQSALSVAPTNGIAAGALAYAYFHSGQYELAKEAATKHIALHGDEFTAYELRAKIYEKLGLDQLAEQDTLQAEKLAQTFLAAPH